MKSLAFNLALFGVALWCGCGGHRAIQRDTGQVFYYDRNGDGKVDLEKHHFSKMADADWELRDDNFDGRYEKKVLHGYGVVEFSVDLPVATGVHIEPKP